jgi:hypothetical protein
MGEEFLELVFTIVDSNESQTITENHIAATAGRAGWNEILLISGKSCIKSANK